jgi:2-polyprenyl-3-methyl-5-hydroxy-6-metoxy-1,4-benzoquinol methylase
MARNQARDQVEDILRYYEVNDEETRLERQQLELLMTIQILNKYLPSSGSILELGAGSGTYTVELASRGYEMTAFDFSEKLIEKNKTALMAANVDKPVEHVVADARDVTKVLAGKKYDAIIVMGPLYHLIKKHERETLMKDLQGMLTKNGVLFTAHMTRVGLITYMLMKFPGWVVQNYAEAEEMWAAGFAKEHPRNGQFRGYWSWLDEIRSLHEDHGFMLEAIHAQDPCIGALDEHFNALSEDLKVSWASYLFGISAHPDVLGAARHVMGVARRAKSKA